MKRFLQGLLAGVALCAPVIWYHSAQADILGTVARTQAKENAETTLALRLLTEQAERLIAGQTQGQ